MKIFSFMSSSLTILLLSVSSVFGIGSVLVEEYTEPPQIFFEREQSPLQELPTKIQDTLPFGYEFLQTKVANDDPEASYFLGTVYEEGYDSRVPKDLKEAYCWYSFAKVMWQEQSQLIDYLAVSKKIEKLLNDISDKGMTVPTHSEYSTWLEKRAKEGSAVAMVLLSDLYSSQGKSQEAIQLLKTAADKNNSLALLKLGTSYKGKEALDFYIKAYNLGEKIAAYYIGSIIEESDGPSQTAVEWHQKAAEQYDAKNKKYLREAIDQKRYIKSLKHLVDLEERGNAFARIALHALVKEGIIEGDDSGEEAVEEKETDRNVSPPPLDDSYTK